MYKPLIEHPRTPEERHQAIANYFLAPDWTAARLAVESNPWLLTREAEEELLRLTAQLPTEQEDSEGESLRSVVSLAGARLSRARVEGGAAFDDLVLLDQRFAALAHSSTPAEIHAALWDEPWLTSEAALQALYLMVLRTMQHDQAHAKRLAAIAQSATAFRQASQLAAESKAVEPHEAGLADIARCERALSLLERDVGSDLWLELQVRLGTYLLELRDGDPVAHVGRARGLFCAILDLGLEERKPAAWEAAVCGFANCLVRDPNADPVAFDEALELLERLLSRLRATGEAERLAIALSCHATVLENAPHGDLDERLERALAARKEEIQVLGSAERNAELWGRAHHNLGALFLKRRRGVRSQNVDDAVNALREALHVRSVQSDPGGRARTLRGLALAVREWTGADSADEAAADSERFLQEAEVLERACVQAAPYPVNWGGGAGERSALNADLDEYLRLPPDEGARLLDGLVARHSRVLERIDRVRSPSLWAEWTGGLGHLLGHLAHFGRPDAAQEAQACLEGALDAVSPTTDPRLCRDLYRSLGENGHRVGDWHCSLVGFANALAASEALFREAATNESRQRELEEMRGFALFAAYAAARQGQLDEAVRLAEHGRSRALVEELATVELLAQGVAPPLHTVITRSAQRIQDLEAELQRVEASDARGASREMLKRFADAVGGDPRAIGIRIVVPGQFGSDSSNDFVRIASELREARTELLEALNRARAESPDVLPDRLERADISGIAAEAGCPIVYLLTTVYGSAALVVPPSGSVELLRFDAVTSDLTRKLFYGLDGQPSYLHGAVRGDERKLTESLRGVLGTLAQDLVQPLAQWLTARDHRRAILIPFGTLGLLPLHAALARDVPVLSYAPSARVLARALAARASTVSSTRSLLAVGDPRRSLEHPLPFAVAEARATARGPFGWSQTTVLTGTEATAQNVLAAARGKTHLHFACHGDFRPSDPMASALLLAGEDRLSLGALLRGEADVSAAQLGVLSACQTANVEFYSLPDEVMGLPTGLLLAGVPGVVSTMWPVGDAAAALFSHRLYQELIVHGREPAAATFAAQRWLRDVKVQELATCVASMRAALDSGDVDAVGELSELLQTIRSTGPSERPFAREPQSWAAFAYFGA